MDPLSISASCCALVGSIGTVSLTVNNFVRRVRDARSDLDAVSRELGSLKTVLELLGDDVEQYGENHMATTLEKQVLDILKNCDIVIHSIGRELKKHGDGKKFTKGVRWSVNGRGDMLKLRSNLEAHRAALDLALEIMVLSITRDIKTDTREIKGDTTVIKGDISQILGELKILHEKFDLAKNAVPWVAIPSTSPEDFLQPSLQAEDGETAYNGASQMQDSRLLAPAEMVKNLSLGESSGNDSYQPTLHSRQIPKEQEFRLQNIPTSLSAQTPILGQRSQTESARPTTSLRSTYAMSAVPQIPPGVPSGLNIAGTGGDINIGNSKQSLSGNFYGGIHVSQGPNQSNPFAAYLPQANMGLNERALLKAAGKADFDEVLRLIRAGANLDAINEEGQSALTMAISRQHMNVVKLLINNGATMDRSGYLVAKPLHVAVGTGNMELVKCILDNGADIDETTAIGPVLIVAVMAGQKNLVSLLLSRNADPDVTGSTTSHSALFWAVLKVNNDLVPMLLKYGARDNCLDPQLKPLMRLLNPHCQALLRDWTTKPYNEHARILRHASSDQVQKQAAIFWGLSCASKHGHKEVYSAWIELAEEFAIPLL
ncbi:uncharacterized protein BDR25DRAFT_374732 [Lindgomyces ingoldianus]|uniref:Uncharacterized protein n=1 Tax=Lindgomyces ingoldianus TaxID=673940 RepID=A0ACB6QLJ2_9PLEO|nr:uncharacterized protein BDR25DRAFT_374732 [Lindgomyces ingoldianus]KAF2467453.1 hypothetical protein BDR25DRAFT_374732 [Lindgomyces ingoldianus]